MILDGGLTLKYKTYTIKSEEDELESLKKNLYYKGIWHLGGRNTQKGGFLPILLTLAKPILLSTAGSIASKLLQGVGKKNSGGRKRRYR